MWLIIIPFQVAAIASIQITNSKTFLCTERKEMAQSYPTLCYPMDCSLPGSSVHGIFQARILEWVATSFPGDLPDPEIKHMVPAMSP